MDLLDIEDAASRTAKTKAPTMKKTAGSATAAAPDDSDEGLAARGVRASAAEARALAAEASSEAIKTDLIAAGAEAVKAVEKAGGAVVEAAEKVENAAEVAGKTAITQVWGILTQHKFLVGGLAIGVPTLMAAFTDVFSTKPTKNTNRRRF
jgi:hypothetical protein